MSAQKAPVQTVAWKLFNIQYRCGVPEMYFHSAEALEARGIVTTGNRQRDREMLAAKRDVLMSPAGMALIYDEGYPITLAEPHDAIEIYKNIVQHLQNWNHLIRSELNRIKAPLDDLKKFDHLAGAIYPLARQFDDFIDRPTGIFEQLEKLNRRIPIRMESQSTPTGHTPVLSQGAAVPPDNLTTQSIHKPIADAIARMQFTRDNFK